MAATPLERSAIIDEEHLRLLALGHVIDGVLVILFSSMFLLHVAMFLFMPFPVEQGVDAPPDGMFRLMGAVLGVFVLLGWAFGALTIYSGRCIKRRMKRNLSLVVACLNLLFLPVGTLLGVASLMVLTRPSVRALYEAQRALRGPP